MAFFEWAEEYSVGLDGIDSQHRKIIELMNEVFDAVRYEKGVEIIKHVYVELLRYANYHFGLELRLFAKYPFDDERKHIEEHSYFIERVKTLMINEYLTDKNVPIEILHFLKSWFQNHMMKTDMEYCIQYGQRRLMEEIEKFLASDDTNHHIKTDF